MIISYKVSTDNAWVKGSRNCSRRYDGENASSCGYNNYSHTMYTSSYFWIYQGAHKNSLMYLFLGVPFQLNEEALGSLVLKVLW